MYVNSTMRAFLKNMSHPAFGPKGEGARRAKNRRRDLGYGILFLPSLIRSDKVPRTTADADPQFGYTSWIMPQVPDRDKVAEQQFSRSPAQVPENQGSGKVPRFRKQPRGRIYAVGCTKVHATDRVPENQFSRKPRFQDHIGPVNEQSLTGGGTA